jgi:hypothetical protein
LKAMLLVLMAIFLLSEGKDNEKISTWLTQSGRLLAAGRLLILLYINMKMDEFLTDFLRQSGCISFMVPFRYALTCRVGRITRLETGCCFLR